MYQIRDWLYIGKYAETADRSFLDMFEISAMLQLADYAPQEGIVTLYLPIDDGANQNAQTLARGIQFVREQKALGGRVLVACAAGISRSTTFALGALKEEEGGDILETLHKIREHHPDALPHIRLWHSLNQYYGEDILYQDIWRKR